jgi:two-component system, chemotaxis family, protein-glutamate methylesterase/glutaminase
MTAVVDSAAPCAVAIGASAGGLPALGRVLKGLPADLPAAVVVVLHLSRQSPSLLPQLLARIVRLPVRAAIEGARLDVGSVYIAVPDLHFVTPDRHVHLSDLPLQNFTRPSVDALFESVALAWGRSSIGVVLTGSGSDGALGLAAIKRAGGTTIVQDPREAFFDAMPRAALMTGCVDYTLPLSAVAPAITTFAAAAALLASA